MYAPETSCIMGTSFLIKNMKMKQLCNRKVPDFAMVLRAEKCQGHFWRKTEPWSLDNLDKTSDYIGWILAALKHNRSNENEQK